MGLEVRGLFRRFGPVWALAGVNLQAPCASIVGLVGPNGAGKSTLLRILARILPADRGEVYLEGRPLARWPRSVAGYLPEERGLYPTMTVQESLWFFGRLWGLRGGQLRSAVERAVELLELGTLLGKPCGRLSRGQARRVQLACACLHGPGLVLLDEPFSGLDSLQARRLGAFLGQLRRQGAVVLFSSHRVDMLEPLCDRLVVLVGGRVVLDGHPSALRRASGRYRVRLAWQSVPPQHELPPVARWWLRQLEGQGWQVRALPGGVWELRGEQSLVDPQPHEGAWIRQMWEEAARLGELRLFEAGYPDLEEVYLQALEQAGHRAIRPAGSAVGADGGPAPG